MGLYPVDCNSCGKPFMWFSGNPHQLCSNCMPVTVVIDGIAYTLDYLRRLIEEDAIKNHK